MDFLYQFNEKYVPFAGTSMVSLMENNKALESIRIFVLGEGISDTSVCMLKKQVEKYNRKIVFIDTEEVLAKIKDIGIKQYRESYATNMKMFVSELLPDDVKKLLYIDSDTLVEGELRDLLEVDMCGKPIAMVLDSVCGVHKKAVGFDKLEDYYNAGVILYDICEWKKQKCTERIVKHLEEVRSGYMAPDQDVINIVMKNQIYKLEPKYNLQPAHLAYGYQQYKLYFGQKGYYSYKQIENAVDDIRIMHFFRFLGQFPWHKGSVHPCVNRFDYYLSLSEWNNYIKVCSANDRKAVYRVERFLYRILPSVFFLPIFKLSYEIYMVNKNSQSMK